jgi:hypothetical protein
MPLTHRETVLPETNFKHALRSTSYSNGSGPLYVVEEINAYIAIRDELLAEAEQMRTRAKLDSVIIANDFVAGCVRPPRKPYEAQSLPEPDAIRERRRCVEVKNRIAELRNNAR